MSETDSDSELENGVSKCTICKAIISTSYITSHNLRMHNIRLRRRRLRCPLCKEVFNFRALLRSHIVEHHQIEIVEQSFDFANWPEFIAWQSEEEKRVKARFNKQRTPIKRKDGNEYLNFYCQYYDSRYCRILPPGKRKRALKSQGSTKIDGCCPAEIVATKSVTGTVNVRYFSTHIGHDIILAHFRLTSENKQEIARKLESSVTLDKMMNEDRILNDICDNVSSERQLTHEDITEQKTFYNTAITDDSIASWKLDEDDTTSVCLWVKNMYKLDHNPVCLFKMRGVDYPTLQKDDFMLIIITKIQAHILSEFGNGIICIDSTHDTNQYNFSLTTLLVADDHEEAFPVAFLYSNRTDETVMKIFFQEISKKTEGVLSPSVFMSDDYPFYYRAWIKVMKPKSPPKKVLCSWHVDKNWSKEIHKICGKRDRIQEKRIRMYQSLRFLLDETDSIKFDNLLGQVMTDLMSNPSTVTFGEYFKKKYVNRYKMWARSFHLDSGINTNIKIENFYHLMKNVYNKGLTMNRLDSCIDSLLRIIRDKYIERIMKLNSVEAPFIIQKLNATHRKCVSIPDEDIERINDSSYKILSQTDGKCGYVITKIVESNSCPFDCDLICRQCDACVHMFKCSCSDYMINCNMCKHVHKLCLNQQESTDHELPVFTISSDEDVKTEYLCNVTPNNEEEEKNKLVEEFSENVEYIKKICRTTDEWRFACNMMKELIVSIKVNGNLSHVSSSENKKSPPRSRNAAEQVYIKNNKLDVRTVSIQEPTPNQKPEFIKIFSTNSNKVSHILNR